MELLCRAAHPQTALRSPFLSDLDEQDVFEYWHILVKREERKARPTEAALEADDVAFLPYAADPASGGVGLQVVASADQPPPASADLLGFDYQRPTFARPALDWQEWLLEQPAWIRITISRLYVFCNVVFLIGSILFFPSFGPRDTRAGTWLFTLVCMGLCLADEETAVVGRQR